jgi:predicted RNA binding protein YcfA (HicA-like mRNA interferase family)
MSRWPSTKAKALLRCLFRLGWRLKSETGSSHRQLVHEQHGEVTWSFHDAEEIGPKMMARLSKQFHFTPDDL